MVTSKSKALISGVLREAVLQSGVTRYRLSQQVGVHESVLSRFTNGKQGITLDTADRLAEVLGLSLVRGVSRVQPAEAEVWPLTEENGHLLTEEEEASIVTRKFAQVMLESFRGAEPPNRALMFCGPQINRIGAVYADAHNEADYRRREREFALLRERVAAKGFEEVATGWAGGEDERTAPSRVLLVRLPRAKDLDTLATLFEQAIEDAAS